MTRDKLRLTQTEFDRCVKGEANQLIDSGINALSNISKGIKRRSFIAVDPEDFDDADWKELELESLGLELVADFAKLGPFDPEVLDELKTIQKRIKNRDITITAADIEKVEKNLLADRALQVTKCLIDDPGFNQQLEAALALKRIFV